MKFKLLFAATVFLSSSAFASTMKFICADTFLPHSSSAKIIINAEASDALTIGNISIESKDRGVILATDSFSLKNTVHTGVEVLSGYKHADKFTMTSLNGKTPEKDYNIILTFGTKWFESLQSNSVYIIGQAQLYCDECGGGVASFYPNLYCRRN